MSKSKRKEIVVKKRTKRQKMSFDLWFDALRWVAVSDYGFTKESAEEFDPEAWEDFYDDGMSPPEALDSDADNS